MSINSRDKGARGERELAHVLRHFGYQDAIRGVQHDGLAGNPDVLGLDKIHIEVKRVEHINIDNAMKQSIRDAREDEIPVVMHRRNNQIWKVTMKIDDWMKFYQSWMKENNIKEEGNV